MTLPLPRDYAPMEALPAPKLPEGHEWHYEPKWDGFRCIAFRDGKNVYLESKSGKPLTRYFPELVAGLASLKANQFVLDGEIVIPVNGTLSFDALLMRIHPAESRIRKLSQATPATFIVFDLLVDDRGKKLVSLSLRERRNALEEFAGKFIREEWRKSGRWTSSQRAYHGFKSIQPRFTTQRRAARCSITGKSMMFPERCWMEHRGM